MGVLTPTRHKVVVLVDDVDIGAVAAANVVARMLLLLGREECAWRQVNDYYYYCKRLRISQGKNVMCFRSKVGSSLKIAIGSAETICN